MTDEYRVFREFHSLHGAEEVIQVLSAHSIEYKITDSSVSTPYDLMQEFGCFLLEIKHEDFEKANQVFEEIAQKQLSEVPTDHYLNDFTSEELVAVVRDFHEWSQNDIVFAKYLLEQRGQGLTTTEITQMHREKVMDSRKPEKAKPFWIVFGFMFAVVGGIMGIGVGHYYWQQEKTDITGNKVYVYDEATRKKGQMIFWLGAISLFCFLLIGAMA